MDNLWEPFKEVFINLGLLAGQLLLLAGRWALVIAWLAWWLWGVNWSRVWLVLGRGAWLVVVLLMLTAALVWSQVAPSDRTWRMPSSSPESPSLTIITVPNFWWQLGGVSTLASTALLCGWIQGRLGWAPPEMSVEPPPEAHGDGHDYGHH